MSKLNRPENFAGRVSYAARVISLGRETSRAFDNCFENDDGDAVIAILARRAQKNPNIAANLYRYLVRESVEEISRKLAHVPTRRMAGYAAAKRAAKGGHVDYL